MIADVVSGGPADDAGLVIGDLIVAVDGEELTADVDLAELIGAFAPGDEIVLSIHNPEASETMEVPITLGAHPDDEERAFLGIAYAIAPMLGDQDEDDAENESTEEGSAEGSETDMDGDDNEATEQDDMAVEEADPADVEKGDLPDAIPSASPSAHGSGRGHGDGCGRRGPGRQSGPGAG